MAANAKASDCRERLIEGAAKVFGREGLQGATTREIAREAGVSELTLFRHFHSKANLLAAVLHQAAEDQSHVRVRIDAYEKELSVGLLMFARAFTEMLEEYEQLIRTLVGEAHRDPASSQQVTDGAFTPWRQSLKTYLENKQETGELRREIRISPMVDHFLAMLVGGMLRRTCPWALNDYTTEDYLRTSVDIFVRGISTENSPASPRRVPEANAS